MNGKGFHGRFAAIKLRADRWLNQEGSQIAITFRLTTVRIENRRASALQRYKENEREEMATRDGDGSLLSRAGRSCHARWLSPSSHNLLGTVTGGVSNIIQAARTGGLSAVVGLLAGDKIADTY